MDLATEIDVDFDTQLNSFSTFSCTLTLTSEGLKKYEKVLEVVFAFINKMKEVGPLDQNYEESSKGAKLLWDFFEYEDAYDTVEYLSERMALYSLMKEDSWENIIRWDYVSEYFDKENYMNVLNCLRIDNCNVYI